MKGRLLFKSSPVLGQVLFAGIIIAIAGVYVASVVAATMHRAPAKEEVVLIEPIQKQPGKVQFTETTTSVVKDDTSSSPQDTPATNTTGDSSKKSGPSKLSYSPPPSPQLQSQYFVYPITGTYLTCQYGVLWYNLGSVAIYTAGSPPRTFTWRLEVSDGTVSDSGTDTMPSDGRWLNFPGTWDYPQSLGSVIGAEDGDRVRFVITSPMYVASPWTKSVPAGTEQSCRAGQMASSVPL